MNLLDILALIILGISAFSAASKGITAELLWLAGVVFGFVLAGNYYPLLASQLLTLGINLTMTGLLAFVLIFVGVITLSTIASTVLRRFWRAVKLSWLDRTLGGLFGLLRGALIVAIILMALTAFPVRKDWVASSSLAPYFLTLGQGLVQLAPQRFQDLFEAGYEEIYQAFLERETEEKQ